MIRATGKNLAASVRDRAQAALRARQLGLT
jgi:hypothetical protein